MDPVIQWFLIGLGILVFGGIPAWFIIDIIQRRKMGLPILDMGAPAATIVLYQPDDVLRERASVEALSNYISRIQYHCLPLLFSAGNQPPDVVVGLKPNGMAHAWLVPKQQAALSGDFAKRLATQPVPSVKGPVMFALCLGAQPQNGVPIPEEWRPVLDSAQTPLEIPDDLFPIVWPESK